MKKLFEYAVIFHKYEELKNGEKVYKDSEIIINPKFTLAESEKEVIFKATREIDEAYARFPDNVEILIRKFLKNSKMNQDGFSRITTTSLPSFLGATSYSNNTDKESNSYTLTSTISNEKYPIT